MKKLLAVVSVAVLMAMTVTGCGKGSEADVAGTYVHEYTEEIDGSEVTVTDKVVLNEDHSAEVSFQDTIAGKWSDTTISLDNGSEYAFTVEGNELKLDMDGVSISFNKQ